MIVEEYNAFHYRHEEDQDMATGDMYKKFVKFGHVVFEICK